MEAASSRYPSWSDLKPGERRIGYEGEATERREEGDDVTMNHTCIKISDPDRSLRFYREVLGFREVMTWNTGPQTVFFLSQPVAETPMSHVFETMQSRQGLIELLHLHGTEPRRATPDSIPLSPHLGYFHIGVTVKSVEAVLARATALGDHGVRIIKALGPPPSMTAMGLPADTAPFHASTDFIFTKVAFISDPDGNWIELVPKAMHKAKELAAP